MLASSPTPPPQPCDIPTYECEVIPGRETRTVRFFCPYCRQRHLHGWPYGEASIGRRASHCVTTAGIAAHPRGYYLVAHRPVDAPAAVSHE
jgi:hypothetical protein